MKATLNGRIVAECADTLEHDGYQYFPRESIRMEWLERAPQTESDRACPHGVQFYDVVIDGARHARVAWSYEAPRAALQAIAMRVGFWKDVAVG